MVLMVLLAAEVPGWLGGAAPSLEPPNSFLNMLAHWKCYYRATMAKKRLEDWANKGLWAGRKLLLKDCRCLAPPQPVLAYRGFTSAMSCAQVKKIEDQDWYCKRWSHNPLHLFYSSPYNILLSLQP
jgi:hypothetical protein